MLKFNRSMAIVIPSARCFSTHRRAFVLGNAFMSRGSRGRVRFYETRRTCASRNIIDQSKYCVCMCVRSPAFAGNRDDVLRKRERIIVVARPAYNFIHERLSLSLSLPSGVSSRVHFRSKRRIRTPADPSSFISPFWSPSCGKGGHGTHTHTFSLSFSRSLFLSLSRVAQCALAGAIVTSEKSRRGQKAWII